MTVLVGGSILAAGTFLLHERHRVLAVSVFAAGVVSALLEGSYRVWDAAEKQLQVAKARLGERDTAEVKRAFLGDCIQEARSFIKDIASQGADWYGENARILEDISHWEAGVRAEIRKAWGPEQAQRFDRHTETETADRYRGSDPASVVQEYMERRITRLAELRDETR
jgi:hypothetical protein